MAQRRVVMQDLGKSTPDQRAIKAQIPVQIKDGINAQTSSNQFSDLFLAFRQVDQRCGGN